MKVKDLIKKLQRMPQEALVRRPPRSPFYRFFLPIEDVYKEWEPINLIEEEEEEEEMVVID